MRRVAGSGGFADGPGVGNRRLPASRPQRWSLTDPSLELHVPPIGAIRKAS